MVKEANNYVLQRKVILNRLEMQSNNGLHHRLNANRYKGMVRQ